MAKHRVIIPTDLKPSPARYEITAAALLADYFKTDVEFVLRSNQKTPDFLINGIKWELKSPTGDGKYNVQHQIKAAAKQSSNVIFDARRSKMRMAKIRKITRAIIQVLKARQCCNAQVLNLLFLCLDDNKNTKRAFETSL